MDEGLKKVRGGTIQLSMEEYLTPISSINICRLDAMNGTQEQQTVKFQSI